MKCYAALDVSTESTSICIVDNDGNIIREGKTATNPTDIEGFLNMEGVELARVGLEAGNISVWLYHGLLAAGLPVVCLETRHANAVLKTQKMKTDRNDARGLAQIVRTGWFKSVHVKSDESQRLRVLLNNRRCLVDQRMNIENQIRGTLKVFGIKVRKMKTRQFDLHVRDLLSNDAELAGYVSPLLDALQNLRDQSAKLERVLIGKAKADPVCRRLMTIPGVGVLTALLYKSAIDKPERFRSSKDVGVALGLTPRKYASGEVDFDGRINKAGDRMLRHHLYKAALSHLVRSNKWSSLKSWGVRIAKRSSLKNACVAVARKLAVIMHRMWLDGTEFQLSEAPSA
jgi:transposase